MFHTIAVLKSIYFITRIVCNVKIMWKLLLLMVSLLTIVIMSCCSDFAGEDNHVLLHLRAFYGEQLPVDG